MRISFDLRAAVQKVITSQGYPGGRWLFKDGKMILLWQAWSKAFPKAKWIICKRNSDDVVASCLRTRFMRSYSDEQGWFNWIGVHEQHIANMHKSLDTFDNPIITIKTDALLHGDFKEFYHLVRLLDLRVPTNIEQFYIPKP